MKFYVESDSGERVYLDIEAESRGELESKIGSAFALEIQSNEESFNINEVVAEKDRSPGLLTTTLGLAVGSLAGPVGTMVGGAIGTGLAVKNDLDESAKVDRFNSTAIKQRQTIEGGKSNVS